MKKIVFNFICLFSLMAFISSCEKDDNGGMLKNDLIKRTVGPNIVGQKIEFVYAAGTLEGSLKEFSVTASIAGDTGTGFEPYAWYTDSKGVDQQIEAATSCTTDDRQSVALLKDTTSLTLRYYYVIPEAARGKTVSFNFTSKSSTGEIQSYSYQNLDVSNVDMKTNIVMKSGENCYFSITDMKAYTLDEVNAGSLSDKIDFIYNYQAMDPSGQYKYGHYFVSPATEAKYCGNDVIVPADWTKNSTAMLKGLANRDGQLQGSGTIDVFVDEIDLRSFSTDGCQNFAGSLIKDANVVMTSADKKSVIYVYINKVDDTAGTITIGFKRLVL